MIYCRYLTDVVFFLINQKSPFYCIVSHMLSTSTRNVDISMIDCICRPFIPVALYKSTLQGSFTVLVFIFFLKGSIPF